MTINPRTQIYFVTQLQGTNHGHYTAKLYNIDKCSCEWTEASSIRIASWMNVRVSRLCDLSEVAMLELYWFYTAGLKSVLMSPIMLLLQFHLPVIWLTTLCKILGSPFFLSFKCTVVSPMITFSTPTLKHKQET